MAAVAAAGGSEVQLALGRADSWGYPPPGRLPDPGSSELFTSDKLTVCKCQRFGEVQLVIVTQQGCTFQPLCLLGGCLHATLGSQKAPYSEHNISARQTYLAPSAPLQARNL